jgi:hypothetical protein
MRTYAETERRRRLVADHRLTVGDWCPGIEDHPAHPPPTSSPTTSSRWRLVGWRQGHCGCCAAARTAAAPLETLT